MLKFKLRIICLAVGMLLVPSVYAESSALGDTFFVSKNIGNKEVPFVENMPGWENFSEKYFLPLKWKPIFENLNFQNNNGSVFTEQERLSNLNIDVLKEYEYKKFSYAIFRINGKLAMLKYDSNYKSKASKQGVYISSIADGISRLTRNGYNEVKFLPEDAFNKMSAVVVSEGLIKTLYSALPYVVYDSGRKNDKNLIEDYKASIVYSDIPGLPDDDYYYNFAIRKLSKTNRSLTSSQKQILSYLNRNFEEMGNVVLPSGERLGNEIVLAPWGENLLIVSDYNGKKVLVDLNGQTSNSLISSREYKVYPFSLLNAKLNKNQLKALKHFTFNKVAMSPSEYEFKINGKEPTIVAPKEIMDILNIDINFKNNFFVAENELSKKVLEKMFNSSSEERDKFHLLDLNNPVVSDVMVLIGATNNKNKKVRYAIIKANKFAISGETDSYLIWKFARASDLDLRINMSLDVFQEVPRVLSSDVVNNLLSASYSSKYLEAAYLSASKVAFKKDGVFVKEKKVKENYAEQLFPESEMTVDVISSIKRLNFNREPYYDVVIRSNGRNFSYVSNSEIKDKTLKIKIKDLLNSDEIENYKPRVF